jgi:hypothetical protein
VSSVQSALAWLDRTSRALVDEDESPYRLTRSVFLRLLGLVYFAAFASAAYQVVPLLGQHGLLPARRFVEAQTLEHGSTWAAFQETPSLFFWHVSDGALLGASLLGAALSLAVLAGLENALVLLVSWALYLSLDHVGQRFWGYGWEMLLVEVGLSAVFLCPARRFAPLSTAAVSRIGVWLMRWILFRLILGAGLIKLRGDPCWTELTCTAVHYETQPIPNPLSWLFHQAPPWVHQLEGAFVLLAEVVAPFFFFGPRRLRLWAGVAQVVLQLGLIVSGNLSFLNYLTLALCMWLFDDRALARLVPARLKSPLAGRLAAPSLPSSRLGRVPLLAFAALIAYWSWQPVLNLISDRQRMNESYNGLHLASSYGMFGGMGHERPELSIEGTDAERPDDSATWREYQLPCKPGDVGRAPCVIAPFQPRLDWQVWFAAMSEAPRQPWLIHMIPKLLANDRELLRLFAHNPFPRTPPRFIRVVQWRYTFTRFGEPGWWKRERLRLWLRPVGKDDPEVTRYLREAGLE